MEKQVTAKELAGVVSRLLTETELTGELDSQEKFQGFMTDIAKVVCDYCGGEVLNSATLVEGMWHVGVHGNDSLPDTKGGIWHDIDPEGGLIDDETSCTRCGTSIENVIGSPSGEEICQDCFDAGAC